MQVDLKPLLRLTDTCILERNEYVIRPCVRIVPLFVCIVPRADHRAVLFLHRKPRRTCAAVLNYVQRWPSYCTAAQFYSLVPKDEVAVFFVQCAYSLWFAAVVTFVEDLIFVPPVAAVYQPSNV